MEETLMKFTSLLLYADYNQTNYCWTSLEYTTGTRTSGEDDIV